MTDREIEELFERLHLLPGHHGKFAQMVSAIREEQVQSRESGRGRKVTLTARSMSPVLTLTSPVKYHRAFSIETNSPRGLISTQAPSTHCHQDEEQKFALLEELEQAKLKIMLLEHQLHGAGHALRPPEKSETPLAISRKSLVFEQQEKAKTKQTRKEVGVSYDSSKMRSTLVNMDIEEMCKCLAKAVKMQLVNKPTKTRYCDSTLPDGLIERYEEAFFEPFKTQLSAEESEVYNFTKNVLIRSKMEKEVVVICLVYLQRLGVKGGLCLSTFNWKRLIFTSMLLASKVWDDDSYENKNFAEAFSIYTADEINAMESSFLALLDFQLTVSGSEYAKMYFLLRTFFDSNHRSFPLRALDVETVRRLQGNATNAENCLRDIHADALYKTM